MADDIPGFGSYTPPNYTADPIQPSLPSYYAAMDNHNYGNGNFQYTNPQSWQTGLDNAGKFLVASAYSAGASVVNSARSVGNFFGGDYEMVDIARNLTELDNDLGRYYVENQQAIDITGFVVGSLVPGLAGVKLLNAGQKALRTAEVTGTMGGNLSRGFGLLPSAADELAATAGKQLAATQATFSWTNANVLKSLAAGTGQAALESAAFEIAVTATMFKSPVLEEMDGTDIAKNILLGTVLGAGVGTAFTAVKTYGKAKSFLTVADLEEKGRTLTTGTYRRATESEVLISASEDLANTPAVPAGLEGTELAKATRQISDREAKLNGIIRTSIRGLAGGDDALGNQMADVARGMTKDQLQASFMYATEIGRLGDKLEAEKALAVTAKKQLPAGETPNTAVQYVRMYGEEAGAQIVDKAPVVTNIADNVKPTRFRTTKDLVLDEVASYRFDSKKLWNAADEAVTHTEAEARYIWADSKAKIADGMTVHLNDIPLQERIWKEWNASYTKLQELERRGIEGLKINSIKLVGETGEFVVTNPDDFLRSLRASKQEVSLARRTADKDLPDEAIAKIANVKRSYLAGEQHQAELSDILARQDAQSAYTKQLVDKGLWKAGDGLVDMYDKPSWAKIAYNLDPIQGTDGNLLQGMAYIAAKQKLYFQAIKNVAASQMGDLFARFTPIPDELLIKANRIGAGPGVASSAQGNYGSLESLVQQIGTATSDLRALWKRNTTDALSSPMHKLLTNQNAAIEFAALENKIRSTSEHYILDPTGTKLVSRKMSRYNADIAAGKKGLIPPVLQTGAPLEIPIVNQEVREAIAARIASNGARLSRRKEIRAAQGLTDDVDSATYYPTRKNLKDYQHFAIVVDTDAVSGAMGHKSMLHAASGKELEQMMDRVPANYKVYTKQNIEEFKKSYGEWDYDQSINENYIDSALKRNGVDNYFFQQTDPQKIVNDWLQDELRGEDILARELVNSLYEKQFTELRRLGELYSGVESSRYTGSYKFAEDSAKNPYLSYVKTALDLNQAAESKFLYPVNQLADSFFSRAIQPVKDAFASAKSVAELDGINDALTKYGARSAYYDTATAILANHSAPRGELAKFVRRANAILSNLTIGFDPLNALNNAIGANVLLGAETRSLIQQIKNANPEAAGELAKLSRTLVPGAGGDSILSATKLITSAHRRRLGPEGKALTEFYKSNGWITDLSKQIDQVHDDLSLRGTETVADRNSRIQRAFTNSRELAQKGRTITGNNYAEEMNRFVAADVMKQITDLAERNGILTPQQSLSYINTFVNRVNGTYLASQRPLMFQGAVGQAVGLFQTYQFNLMQQLFRYVGQGTSKDAAVLLGLQGTLYGLNGMPAFNFLNTHIVGSMSGNPNHTDAYTATYGIFGQTAGDWLLYGAPSNLLQTNIYSRGDINPRHVTLIPTNPADIPFINASFGFFGNLKNTFTRLAGGGNVWETMLQGIEHNKLSRPLAGMAQVMQGLDGGQAYSTDSSGRLMGANDIFDLATISRLAGGRPLDEAVVNDAVYRTAVYKSVDNERKQKLREAIRTTVIANNSPTADEWGQFAGRYAELGGDSKRFNSYMLRQIRESDVSRADDIVKQLKSPYAQNMQVIMGGRDVDYDPEILE